MRTNRICLNTRSLVKWAVAAAVAAMVTIVTPPRHAYAFESADEPEVVFPSVQSEVDTEPDAPGQDSDQQPDVGEMDVGEMDEFVKWQLYMEIEQERVETLVLVLTGYLDEDTGYAYAAWLSELQAGLIRGDPDVLDKLKRAMSSTGVGEIHEGEWRVKVNLWILEVEWKSDPSTPDKPKPKTKTKPKPKSETSPKK